MRLLFKQRFFSWFDSYDIYDEEGRTVYIVKGKLAWGHCLKIYLPDGREVGTVKERVFSFMPQFEIYSGGNLVGTIRREFSFFKPRYNIDYNGWSVEGDFWQWDYSIKNVYGAQVAYISKEFFRLTDTYVLDIVNLEDALSVLAFVLAMDAEKCSRDNN